MALREVIENEEIILDTFIVAPIAAGTNQFVNHGPDKGFAYVQHPAFINRFFAFDTAGRVYGTGGTSSTALYYALPKPPAADVDVSGWFNRITVAANEAPGVCGRWDGTANTGIVGRFNAATGNIELIEINAGTAVQTVTSTSPVTWNAAETHKITLRLRGNQASVLFDDVQVVVPTTVGLTGNNYAALRLGLGAATSATTGIHATKFEVVDFDNKGAYPGYEPGPDHPSQVTRKPLPTRLNQRSQTNGGTFVRSNVLTYNGNQYVIYVNEARNPIICKRALPNGDWSTFDLSTVGGNPLATPTLEDPHNIYSIGIGSDGYIHVAGNMHDVAINYVRSTNPEDITAWVSTGAPNPGNTQITYPQFLKLPSGNLVLFTRTGVSGNGAMRVNKWDSTAQSWGSNVAFLDGNPTSESPYINLPAVHSDGTIHIFYCWRATSGSADNNQDICHIKSADEGTTWTDISGSALTLPITHTTSPLILDTASSGAGLLNQGGAAVDANGHPHAAFFLYDGSSHTQVNHFYHDGSAWRQVVVTAWDYHYDLTPAIVDATIARPAVFCPNDGTTWLLLRHNVDDAGTYYALNVSPASSTKRVIWRAKTYYLEAVYDSGALADRNELHMLVAPAAPVSATNADMTAVQWQSVNGWVVSVPVGELASLPSS